MKDVFSSLETDAGNHRDPITRRTSGPTTGKHKADLLIMGLNNFKIVFDVWIAIGQLKCTAIMNQFFICTFSSFAVITL